MEFEKLCALQCTQQEICDFLEVDHKTLTRWCKRTYKKEYSQVYAEKKSGGKISLRRMQFRLAEKSPSFWEKTFSVSRIIPTTTMTRLPSGRTSRFSPLQTSSTTLCRILRLRTCLRRTRMVTAHDKLRAVQSAPSRVHLPLQGFMAQRGRGRQTRWQEHHQPHLLGDGAG